ncbi:MAG: TIGR02466 family protein [Proteobacteria bacterium]|nr:TIGR02466 family protein [Pseudomonadota bacterium]
MSGNSETQRKDGLRVLFPTLIYEAWYPDYGAESEQLIGFVRQLREEDKEGQRLSAREYPSGYTSYFTRSNLYSETRLAGLVNFIHQCAGNYAQQHRWDTQNFQPVINAMFANINPRFSFHPEHLHPYSHISGVFYVRSEPGNPAISFKDPRPARWMMPPAADGSKPENTFNARVAPEPGKLLMFPSWLEHGVPQNQTEEERISMSFNFEMRPRQK